MFWDNDLVLLASAVPEDEFRIVFAPENVRHIDRISDDIGPVRVSPGRTEVVDRRFSFAIESEVDLLPAAEEESWVGRHGVRVLKLDSLGAGQSGQEATMLRRRGAIANGLDARAPRRQAMDDFAPSTES
jgi:hypothetical protein